MPALFALLLLLTSVHPAQSTVFWDEDFEDENWSIQSGVNGSTGWYVQGGSPEAIQPMPGRIDIVTGGCHSGSKCVRLTYTDLTVGEGPFAYRYFSTRHAFTRAWIKIPTDFQISGSATKFVYGPIAEGNIGCLTFSIVSNGRPIFSCQTNASQYPGSGGYYLGNQSFNPNEFGAAPVTPPIKDGQWHCLESEAWAYGTGAGNGEMRFWIDGVIPTNGELVNVSFSNNSNPFNILKIYQERGIGYLYHDDIAVGDQRIGCSGTPPPDDGGGDPPPSGPVLGIAGGRFTINGVATKLLGISYFDVKHWHSADLDALQSNGFNLVRVILDNQGLYSGRTQSIFNADGSIDATDLATVNSLLDAAAARNLIVELVILHADTDPSNSAAWLTTGGARTAAITNAINAFKARTHVLFNLVNEHVFGAFADAESEMSAFMTTARAACNACLIFYDSSEAGGPHLLNEDDSVVGAQISAEVATGISVLAPHTLRNVSWYNQEGARTANVRSYLNSLGQSAMPLYFNEEARRTNATYPCCGSTVWTAQNFLDAAKAHFDNGGAGWVFHTSAAFDLSGGTMVSHFDSIESSIVANLAAYVGGGGGGPDTTPPTQVTGLTVTPASSTSLFLSWMTATDDRAVADYHIEQCQGASCNNFAQVTTATITSATIGNLTPNTTYRFRVRAQDTSDNFGAYSTAASGTTTDLSRRTLATDTFNRANGALGANWAGSYSGFYDATISGNSVRSTNVSNDSVQVYTAQSLPNDQWGQIDLTTIQNSSEVVNGVILRAAAPTTQTWYTCRARRNSTALPGVDSSIERTVDGSPYTRMATVGGNPWQNGDKLRCEIQGNVITMLRVRNGVETVVLTHTDGQITSGSRAGILVYGSTPADGTIDNFTIGDYTAPVALPAITAVTTDATGATVTWSGSPTTIRVVTNLDSVLVPIASFPGGRYTRTWAQGITSACFYALDSGGVENTSGFICASVTPQPPPDTTPPVISACTPTGTLQADTTSTPLTCQTDEPATCKWSAADQAFGAMPNTMTTVNGISHTSTRSGLTSDTAYTSYVRCQDTAGNVNTSSTTISFSVEAQPPTDTTAPSDVVGLNCNALGTSAIQCTWNTATDNVAVDYYIVYLCPGLTCALPGSVFSVVGTTTGLTWTLPNLDANTLYTLGVDAVDTSGNPSAGRTVVSVMTLPLTDPIPPSDMANLRLRSDPQYNIVNIEWDPGTDNVGISRAVIERCTGVGCTNFQSFGVGVDQFVDLTVEFGTTYRYRGKFIDVNGLPSANYSAILDVTTPEAPADVQIGVCPCKTR